MIYFDNAATTQVLPEVLSEMNRVALEAWGNPSSIHSIGQKAKVEIDNAREKVANLLSAKTSEIFFTSSATEGIGLMLPNIVKTDKIQHIITSAIEHSAVLKTLKNIDGVEIHYVKLLADGSIDLSDLKGKLEKIAGSKLVVLMHANNEIGNLLPVKKVSELCKEFNALFFVDMVQTVGKYKIALDSLNIDFAVASGHKFHGPKGVGMLFVKSGKAYPPLLFGGSQERNMRAGTENTPAIAGFAKALEIAMVEMDERIKQVSELKLYFVQNLKSEILNVKFNGNSEEEGLYSILNVSLPTKLSNELLNMKFDMAGIAMSQGSACSSGVNKPSPVIQQLYGDTRNAIRFSFSKVNTKDEVDRVIQVIHNVIN